MKKNYNSKSFSALVAKSKQIFNRKSSALWGLTIAMVALFLPQTSISSEELITSWEINNPTEVVSNEMTNRSSNNIGITNSARFVSMVAPSFSKSFSPNEIGPGSVTTLTFVIDNSASAVGLTNIAFTDVLPAGMTIATPANPTNSCGFGTLSAPDGGSAISYSGGTLGAGSVCTMTVNVTSNFAATYMSTTGDLTSSEGNSGTATASLTVANDRPGFSKSFSPTSIEFGGRSTLTFTIDNTANISDVRSLSFTDNLPVGMVVASPANINVSCTGGTVTANPGSSTILYNYPFSFPALAAGSSCTISVDVFGTSAGNLGNVTENLMADTGLFVVDCGKASAVLNVLTPSDIAIEKRFVTNPVNPGGTTNLEFTITNRNRNFSATNVSFTDDLTAVLAGLTASGLPISSCGGTMSGTTMLDFIGGNIPSGGSCTITVPLQIPLGAAPGVYTNITGAVTADINGTTVVGNMAIEVLYIENSPTFTKTFLTNPVAAGGTTTLEFTITNNSLASALTDISFTDPIGSFLSGVIASNLPAAGSCGAGSFFFIGNVGAMEAFQMSGGEIPAGGSCTFTIDLSVPVNTAGGTYTNTTSYLSANIDGQSISVIPATDDLTVLAVPRLSKSFIDDPVAAGDIVNLEFTITYNEFASGDATGVSFTDDLNAVIPGLAAVGLPLPFCGGMISGTTTLTFSGGTMAPGDVCTFSVPVQVPIGTAPGGYLNTTSALTATVGGLAATGNVASDELIVGGLTLTKEFIDNPVIPGELTTLRFTIDNTTTFEATDVFFVDNLGGVLSGLVAEAPLPMLLCEGAISGTNLLVYTSGTVDAGTSCVFDVMVRIPAGAASGTYTNNTSNLTATLNGSNLVLPIATANIIVNDNLLLLTKSFTNDPVTPGDPVTLEYTLTNLDLVNAVTNIVFTDNFNAALSGLAATGLPATECGGAMIDGTGLLSFTGGSLAAGSSCTFSVILSTPITTPFGTVVTSTTSSLTGDFGGFTVVGDPASDDLLFQSLRLTKSIAGPVDPGATTVITFTITNDDPVNAINQISFTDDLDAFISGMVATVLPAGGTCGVLSGVTGTSLVLFSRGSLGPGESCSFDVTVLVPLCTTGNTYINTTSTITGDGIILGMEAPAATANLTVNNSSTVTFTAPADLCIDAGVQTGLSGGTPVAESGVYSGEGVTDGGSGTTTYSFDPAVAGVGTSIITYTFTQVGGCTISASGDVELFGLPVVTFQPPVSPICPNTIVTGLGDGAPSGGFYSGDGVTDDGNGMTFLFDSGAAGTVTLTYTFTDGNGCANSALGMVTVDDSTPPVVTCPADITVSNDPGRCDAVVTFMASATDNCSGVTTSSVPASGSVFPVGTTAVTVTATDASGNMDVCTFNVTVDDDEDPVASCPADITVGNDPGQCNAVVTFTLPDLDNCPGVTLASVPPSGSVFSLGTTVVTVTATDAAGNSDVCTFDVTVNDDEDPIVTCPADITVSSDLGQCDTVVAFTTSATDNCPGVTTSSVPASGSVFPVGTTTVTVTATDAAGRTGVCMFDVIVEDIENPVALCQNITIDLDANGNATIEPSDVDNGSFDLCGMVTGELSQFEFDCSHEGENMVTLTITDESGNMASCIAMVTVNAIIPDVEVTYSVLPDFCQGNGVLLTAESDDAISYNWTTGETTQVIEVSVDDTYGVTVTTSTGCTAYGEYVLTGFDITTLTSAYTMIAKEEIHLHGNNSVLTGALGVRDSDNEGVSDGKIKIKDFSDVTGFAKAARIEIDATSSVGSTILSPVTVSIPTFLNNTESNNGSPDVTVQANQVMTLSGDVYDKIEIKEGATVIFTEANIFIDELKTKKDITIEFSGCTYLYINKKLKFESNTTLNALGHKVVMYVDDKIEIKEGGYFTATMYANNQEINVKGKSNNPTNMIGMFIAKKIKGEDYVNWEMDASCITCPPPTGRPFVLGDDNLIDIASSVKLYPNPAEDYVILNNPNNIVLKELEIFDLRGRLIKSVNLENMETEKSINISGLESAVYFILIRGVDEQLMKKLVVK